MSDRTPGIRPHLSLWRRLDIAARHTFPVACTWALMLAATAPFGLPDQAALLPALALGCVYFWTIFRPRAMSALAVFFIGVLLDLLGNLPLGTGALTLLAAHGITMQARRVLLRQAFLVAWLGFALLATAAALLIWLLAAALTVTLLPFGPALFQAALSIALYPLLSAAFLRAHHTIADPDLA